MPNVRIAADGTTLNWKQLKCLMFKKETTTVMLFKKELWDDYRPIAINIDLQRS
jgi:hypothetical protein